MRIQLTAATVVTLVLVAGCERRDSGDPAPAAGVRAEEAPATRPSALGAPGPGVVAEFERRVDDYMAVHEQLSDTLDEPPNDATPRQIDAHQRALAALIAKARADARPGLVFSPDMQAYVRGVVRRMLDGPDGRQLRASISDENPAGTSVRVNGRYPDAVPMSTMPPDVLAALPRLPEELQYRFVGDRLILLDTKAHIVVDYVEDVLPA